MSRVQELGLGVARGLAFEGLGLGLSTIYHCFQMP